MTPTGLRVPDTDTYAYLVASAGRVVGGFQRTMGDYLSTPLPGRISDQIQCVAPQAQKVNSDRLPLYGEHLLRHLVTDL